MMRRNLLTTSGEEGEEQSTRPIALLYYRNVLGRKAAGAQGRELLNISCVIDALLRARPAQALDILCQRLNLAGRAEAGVGFSGRDDAPGPRGATDSSTRELPRLQGEVASPVECGSQGYTKREEQGQERSGLEGRQERGHEEGQRKRRRRKEVEPAYLGPGATAGSGYEPVENTPPGDWQPYDFPVREGDGTSHATPVAHASPGGSDLE